MGELVECGKQNDHELYRGGNSPPRPSEGRFGGAMVRLHPLAGDESKVVRNKEASEKKIEGSWSGAYAPQYFTAGQKSRLTLAEVLLTS